MQFTSKNYPGIPHAKLKEDSRLKDLNYKNLKLDNVENSFNDISETGSFLSVHDDKLFKGPRYSGRNRGDSVAKTHFQGICRVKNGKNFLFSGGDFSDSAAQIFSSTVDHFKNNIKFPVGMSTIDKGNILRGPIGSNLLDDEKTPPSDKLCFVTQINDRIVDGKDGKGFWHAGGISILGDILSVPLESEDSSKIRFFSIKNPNKPVHLDKCDIPRSKDVGKAGTATLCRLSNDRFLCAVWQDGKQTGDQNIDFYISKDDKLENGFKSENIRWFYRDLISRESSKTKYQVLEFVVQSDDQIYLVGTENNSPIAPMADMKGDNIAELLKFSCDLNFIDQPKKFEDSINITLAKKREFATSKDYHNFSAGAGIYISSEKELLMYSVYHYRRKDKIRFVEFPPVISSYKDEIKDVTHAKIELYEKENFKGRVIRIYGRASATINDYKNCFAQEKNFGKGVGSVKYILPADSTYAFYEDKNCRKKDFLFELTGTGFIEEKDKMPALSDEIMSSKFVNMGGIKLSDLIP